jgi:hypothetical protein
VWYALSPDIKQITFCLDHSYSSPYSYFTSVTSLRSHNVDRMENSNYFYIWNPADV